MLATDAPTLAARLRVTATRLARLLRQQADIGLTPSQLAALTTIEVHGPLTLGALADHERVAPPSITKLVNKLKDAGLVAAMPGASDRRVSVVSATPAGLALLATSRRRKNLWLAARVAKLDPLDRERLAGAIEVLERLTAGDAP